MTCTHFHSCVLLSISPLCSHLFQFLLAYFLFSFPLPSFSLPLLIRVFVFFSRCSRCIWSWKILIPFWSWDRGKHLDVILIYCYYRKKKPLYMGLKLSSQQVFKLNYPECIDRGRKINVNRCAFLTKVNSFLFSTVWAFVHSHTNFNQSNKTGTQWKKSVMQRNPVSWRWIALAIEQITCV